MNPITLCPNSCFSVHQPPNPPTPPSSLNTALDYSWPLLTVLQEKNDNEDLEGKTNEDPLESHMELDINIDLGSNSDSGSPLSSF